MLSILKTLGGETPASQRQLHDPWPAAHCWSFFSAISSTGKSTELLPLWFEVRILDGGPVSNSLSEEVSQLWFMRYSFIVVNPPMRRGVPADTWKGNLSDAGMFAGVILTGRHPAPLSQLLLILQLCLLSEQAFFLSIQINYWPREYILSKLCMWWIPSKRWGVWLTAICRYARDFDNQR